MVKVTNTLFQVVKVTNTLFQVVKVTNAAGETVEETIQKYVSNVSANATSSGGQQQIIILKYTEPEEVKVKAEPILPATRTELQQVREGREPGGGG